MKSWRPLWEAGFIFKKEIVTLARDRHTLIYSVLLPLLLYPSIVWGTLQVLTYARGVEERKASRVLVVDGRAAQAIAEFLAGRPKLKLLEPAPPAAGARSPGANDRDRALALLEGEGADAVLLVQSGGDGGEGEAGGGATVSPLTVRLLYSSARDSSLKAKQRLEEALKEFRQARLLAAAHSLDEGEDFLKVLDIEVENLSTDEEFAKYIAALILPLLMIVMTAMGAFYPALDSTVGEKERGTLETTLLLPVRRSSLVLGKFLAVVTFALMAFGLNFGSMLFTLAHLRDQLKLEGFELGAAALAIILAAAFLLSFFLSALMMLLGFFARSFKEGQTYVTPVYLLAVMPAIFAAGPEASLTPPLAAVPIVNIALLLREALKGRLEGASIALTLLFSAIYAGLALACCGRFLRREEFATGMGVSRRGVMETLFGARARRQPASRGLPRS